ncbi:hypothetical protein BD324DRAFT_449992 [Kockovaella imperatae]|uniref:Glycosyl transferase family 1 domain-containing protein n=1 Tax=Kockovaella imperatae TaxID=4999 RepID=A0A1Y1UJY2_9TREE|nr:hypothetical protein BD324DRAFT_449992 [Kockovaella imperatae]ORX37435.1 hypothetical protein BD324DRAFT_449992 [Kockovaella imperatae]
MSILTPPSSSPECDPLPATQHVPHLDLDNVNSILGAVPFPRSPTSITSARQESLQEKQGLDPLDGLEERAIPWRGDLTPTEKVQRREWLSAGRGRSGLRIVIVTENFLPKVDGVTRTLARLLEHLEREGHQCMLLGPGTGMDSYAGHPLVGTAGIPLIVYPGLKLNFLRPRFLNTIKAFQPDVVHFVDPIWLGAQTLMAMELGWAGKEWVSEEGPALGAGISGGIVASYHTNLATYATLFGMPRLEPVIWRFQRWLYSNNPRTRLTLCPSPSTTAMLHSQSFDQARLWPRGVDLAQFSPCNRSRALRASWGVSDPPRATFALPKSQLAEMDNVAAAATFGVHHQGRKVSLPLTPPESPAVIPADLDVLPKDSVFKPEELGSPDPKSLKSRVVLLYVGRVSWEKNLNLLLSACAHLPSLLPPGALLPKLVFVGDGPARADIQALCQKEGYDASFMGFRAGKELAECYASADVFAFPSFTETFGQVVLESMASGLPVIGLDAEGTRDLVSHNSTGLLLRLPPGASNWPEALKSTQSSSFGASARSYADLLAEIVKDHAKRVEMGERASTKGIEGYTWWDAMEKCVDGYRESLRMSLSRPEVLESPASPKISRVNRVVSMRLAHKDAKNIEGALHLKNLLKIVMVLCLFYAVYAQSHSRN